MLTNGELFFKLRDGTNVYKSDVVEIDYFGSVQHIHKVRYLYYFKDGIPCHLPVNSSDFDLFIYHHGGFLND